MELTFAEDHDALIFYREHNLSSLPLRVDLLVIRKKDGVPIRNRIGQIFLRNNLFEYKAPGDELNIDTYYKTIAYACLYKTQGRHVDEIKDSEITVTMLRNNKPEKLMSELKKRGITAEEYYPGIYHLHGDKLLFNTQIIVTKELPSREYNWLQSLTNDISNEEVHQLVTDASTQPRGSWQSRAAEEVVQVAMNANSNRFEDLKKEDSYMYKTLMDFMRPEIDEEINAKVKQTTEQVTKSVTSKVRKEDREKQMAQLQKHIKSLIKQGVSIDILTETFGDEIMSKVTGTSASSQ